MMRLRVLSLMVAATLFAAPLHAQSMSRVAEICSDPMTTGPQKGIVLEADGWTKQPKSSLPAVTAIANAHIASFTAGMKDWTNRYAAIPQLAGNFTTMIDAGDVALWTKGDAFLAVSIQQTPEGTEHLACYFAGPENPETPEVMARYGTPEEFPEQGLTAIRFDETAMVMDPERNYQMYSFFSRHKVHPDFATPDGYRLERIEKPKSE
ncbi:hypothetical protein G5B38_15425 [Pseudohalocynthiibacter aestuariivivens]|nr:hypothetical protein [Pseudohalocynthiibacter aestuariivivens]QIE46802.1 hypothetical protein G5B38_15425 [Pseudohalocynthiibacter aestuariivivens]